MAWNKIRIRFAASSTMGQISLSQELGKRLEYVNRSTILQILLTFINRQLAARLQYDCGHLLYTAGVCLT